MRRPRSTWWRRFRRSEDGSGTIEFVLLLPFFLILFLSTFELGMLMTRHVMLDRALDMSVRQVRLGNLAPVNHDTLTTEICSRITIMPDCLNDLRLEMRPENPRAYIGILPGADCVDRDDSGIPLRQFTPGVSNQLMILRACALFDPFFPTTGLATSIPKQSGGAYALVSTSSFVIE